MVVEEFSYQNQILELSRKSGFSENRVRQFLKLYRRLLKERLSEGKRVYVEGLFDIRPSVRRHIVNEFHEGYGYADQLEDLSKNFKMSEYDINSLLKGYLRLLKLKLEMGYWISITGVVLIKPVEKGEDIFYEVRLSPTLEYPKDFRLRTSNLYGVEEILELGSGEDNEVFKLELSDTLYLPHTIRYENQGEIRYIGEEMLG